MQNNDLTIIATPYMVIGFVVLLVLVLFLVNKLPHTSDPNDERETSPLKDILARLAKNPLYIAAMVIFVSGRFIRTYFFRFISSGAWRPLWAPLACGVLSSCLLSASW